MGNNQNILYRDTQYNSNRYINDSQFIIIQLEKEKVWLSKEKPTEHSSFRLSAIIAFSFSFRYNNRIWKLTLFAKKINNEIMEKTS